MRPGKIVSDASAIFGTNDKHPEPNEDMQESPPVAGVSQAAERVRSPARVIGQCARRRTRIPHCPCSRADADAETRVST